MGYSLARFLTKNSAISAAKILAFWETVNLMPCIDLGGDGYVGCDGI